MGSLYARGYGGGDVDDPAGSALVADLDEIAEDLPPQAREALERHRKAIEEDEAAWKRRHDEAAEADDAAENLADVQRTLAEQGFDVDLNSGDVAVTPALLARHVAAMSPWERADFDRLLAEETGDAWTRLPKVAS